MASQAAKMKSFKTYTTMNESIAYTAVVLDKKSHDLLVSEMKHHIPEGWEVYAHHMTINMGAYKIRDEVGKRVTLTASSVAHDAKVVAVSVYGYPSSNSQPHITVAVNKAEGGKPKDSNSLKKWETIHPIRLTGTVTEVSQ